MKKNNIEFEQKLLDELDTDTPQEKIFDTLHWITGLLKRTVYDLVSNKYNEDETLQFVYELLSATYFTFGIHLRNKITRNKKLVVTDDNEDVVLSKIFNKGKTFDEFCQDELRYKEDIKSNERDITTLVKFILENNKFDDNMKKVLHDIWKHNLYLEKNEWFTKYFNLDEK